MSSQLIDELLAGSRHIGHLVITEGALPPKFILEQAASAMNQGEPAFWHGPRLFIVDEISAVVGAGGYKGSPANGCVEIGYNIAASCQAKGYGTEAVRQLVQEALLQPGINQIRAETAIGNIASRRVVERAGFAHVGQTQTASDGLVDQWVFRTSSR